MLSSEPISPPVVEMRGITKRFAGGVLANDNVDLRLDKGEILALLGENGAGKSTLMNILYGLHMQDAGEIYLRGEQVRFHSAHDAINHGLGMVHQHFMLVPPFTVAQNIVLGQPSPRAPLLESPKAVARHIERLSEQYGLEVDPAAEVWQLSVGQEQRVEILKALYRGGEILILDEPTGVLTPQEVEELLKIMRTLAEKGQSLIFISHKLEEVMRISQRIAVLRDGRLVDTLRTEDTNPAELSRMMVGRDVLLRVEREPATPGPVRLSITDLHSRDDRNLPALRGVTLQVRAGEILGVAGVEGNGQRELEETIAGLRAVERGQVSLDDRDITNASPGEIFRAGLGYLPSDRQRTGLIGDFSVAENLLLQRIDQPPFTHRGFLDHAAIQDNAQKLVKQFDIRTPSTEAEVSKLSGGNAQKVMLARELTHNPRILLVAQPTRGLDVGTIEYIHRELVQQRDRGMAILLVSTELEEILSLSDRILVLYEGQMMGERQAAEADTHELGLMMAGSKSD
jgi:simple sugar transport system ATP-binding protein